MRHFDVVIVGAGPVGLNFAATLLEANLDVALVEQLPRTVLENPAFDGREIALTHASAQRLRDNGVWAHLPAAEISPLRDARVWNGSSPFYMQIDHRDGHEEELGFLVASHLLRRAAWERIHTAPRLTLFCDTRVTAVTTAADGATARMCLEDGTMLSASLAVAADTRFSETRRAAGISATLRDFGRTMLVCRMQHEQPHHHIAWEWFDYDQTLALLPLNGACSSVVITVDGREAQRLQNLGEVEFNSDMQRRLRNRLGAMQLVSPRYAYPLVGVYADRFVARRYALIGDAAVGMHPVTAHGFNLGLLGQARLAQEVIAAAARGHDIGAPDLLARYERAHRRATLPLYLTTNALVRLYTAEAPPLRFARHALLRLADRVTPLRKVLATSLTQSVPPSARNGASGSVEK